MKNETVYIVRKLSGGDAWYNKKHLFENKLYTQPNAGYFRFIDKKEEAEALRAVPRNNKMYYFLPNDEFVVEEYKGKIMKKRKEKNDDVYIVRKLDKLDYLYPKRLLYINKRFKVDNYGLYFLIDERDIKIATENGYSHCGIDFVHTDKFKVVREIKHGK